jgi:uncharacterized protein YyaL (SSP411 family)
LPESGSRSNQPADTVTHGNSGDGFHTAMNRLSSSTSLYLQQHAANPVDWQPWDDQSLAHARELDRPILLSIGYSACHWCHVMAHECFEDEAIARVMNELYVNIKVDREERPDLDRVYQLSHQLLTGRGGGWPLTVFIDPDDLTPFFAGTYFPPAPRHGLPAFAEILRKVRQWYDSHRDQVKDQSRQLADAIGALQASDAGDRAQGAATLDNALAQLQQRYDAQHGGFGGAPKFPQAPLLSLVQTLSRPGREHHGPAAGMLRDSLLRMALSGLRDHLDGGFFRYTVDGAWTIPHFEKMLYDNAMLLPLYAEAAQRWEEPLLRETGEGIAAWLETEMRHANGGFYASIDADAAGVEGGFHVWQRDEIRQLLDDEEFARVEAAFGLASPPNFEDDSWHLVRRDGPGGGPLPESALHKLRAARARRTPPGTDTKQLTAWNALCIEGLARAGKALGRDDWLDLAEQALEFIRSRMWSEDGLYAVYAGGRAQFSAYLDDHAYLLNGMLMLLQERWKPAYLEWAVQLADVLLEQFEDRENGGFYFTSASESVPIHRMRPMQDDATPAGNAVAARALLALGHLTADTRYLDAARRTLDAAGKDAAAHPLAFAGLLVALDEYAKPPVQVIICGGDRQQFQALKAAAGSIARGRHRVNCYALETGGRALPGILGAIEPRPGAAAYVCRGLECLPPAASAEELLKLLEDTD